MVPPERGFPSLLLPAAWIPSASRPPGLKTSSHQRHHPTREPAFPSLPKTPRPQPKLCGELAVPLVLSRPGARRPVQSTVVPQSRSPQAFLPGLLPLEPSSEACFTGGLRSASLRSPPQDFRHRACRQAFPMGRRLVGKPATKFGPCAIQDRPGKVTVAYDPLNIPILNADAALGLGKPRTWLCPWHGTGRLRCTGQSWQGAIWLFSR
ncbi:hypothetical protein MPNT_10166 [Candidatus Methylacidithermus pantelleriae]|uniref:Uncharacterized protein n=1 Tax=Candidatus Methylacidithermus pantelleriae TaxID=2744239 RepID=A0A8J2FRK7_9BACT|nr:hypothetical protein MPNT_10166 [Candidatus Methylacidithermus pantelleriae]